MTGTTRHLQQACPKDLGLTTKDIPSHPRSPKQPPPLPPKKNNKKPYPKQERPQASHYMDP